MINYQSCNSYIGGLKTLSYHIVQNVSHPDLENAVSGANDACGHFCPKSRFLRTILVKYPILGNGGKMR